MKSVNVHARVFVAASFLAIQALIVPGICAGQTPQEECRATLESGKVSWGGGTTWMPDNMALLCDGTTDAARTINCFTSMMDSGATWQTAIDKCRATSGTPGPVQVAPIVSVAPFVSMKSEPAPVGDSQSKPTPPSPQAEDAFSSESTPPPAARTGPVNVRTQAIQATGTGTLATRLAFSPLTVRTVAIQVTGTGSAASGGTFSPKVVRTAPFTVTGTGPN